MRKMEFMRLREFTDSKEEKDSMNNLEIGDKFLYGKSVIGQKQNKEVGNPITFYIVIEKNQNGIVYSPQYEILEEDRRNE